MKVTINSVEQLYELDRALFNQIKKYLGITDGKGIYRVNLTVDLPIAFAEAVKRFQDKNHIELWNEQQTADRNAEAKRQQEKDEIEAVERVKVWFTRGLLVNDYNAAMLKKVIAENMGGVASAVSVDFCMNQFRDSFQWQQVAPPPPPPPPPPPVILSDGSHQLPLGTPPSSRHTVVQLRDLDARNRAKRAKEIRENNNAVAAANKPAVLEVV